MTRSKTISICLVRGLFPDTDVEFDLRMAMMRPMSIGSGRGRLPHDGVEVDLNMPRSRPSALC